MCPICWKMSIVYKTKIIQYDKNKYSKGLKSCNGILSSKNIGVLNVKNKILIKYVLLQILAFRQ